MSGAKSTMTAAEEEQWRHEMLNYKMVPRAHDNSRYGMGHRCAVCRKAHAAYARDYRRRLREAAA